MKKSSTAGVFGLAVASVVAFSAQAKELKFNNPLPESRPETQELIKFADEVAANSGGELGIRLFNGGSMTLKNADLLRTLPRGVVDMSLLWANYLGRDAPALSTVLVQGSIGNVEELEAALPVVKDIYAKEFDKWGVKTVGNLAIPMLYASVFCRDEPVRTLDDLKSKKLRVWSKDQVMTFTKLGVSAQIINQDEMYISMKTGVVDCALYPALYAHTASLQETAKYASYLYPIAAGPYTLGMATSKWDALSEEEKAALQQAADNVWERTNEYSNDLQREMAAREKLGEQGVTFLEDFPQEDRDLFLSTVSGTWKELTDEAGGDAPKYRQQVLEALGRS
ncbi:C4-dicarboxylate ABC transporter substrate-binding protein [Rhodobacteraceae bacterium RKSG542]|uniref:TRAP transporter substrate-binding protein DctP n=1 Tax=Pseudovibrio flavus TaxID=2529854 RepID=UPI0012BD06CD|nr:TRAP transporter substrate-binding protein DctP [Pseudovibrio flavus]MTI18063.1 C4-dicarboxylate ABC transporter substrate-binding protein [Pseudovibrio flavus]